MDADFFIKLTLALYKVTEKFPEKEPLKFLIREKAVLILSDSILLFHESPSFIDEEKVRKLSQNLVNNIEVLQAYFKVAENQDWVNENNFIILSNEYNKQRKQVSQFLDESVVVEKAKKYEAKEQPVVNRAEKKITNQPENPVFLNERQKRILEILKQKNQAQVKDIEAVLGNVSKRTIRRDFAFLYKRGIVERKGDKNNTLYKLK